MSQRDFGTEGSNRGIAVEEPSAYRVALIGHSGSQTPIQSVLDKGAVDERETSVALRFQMGS